MEAEYCTWLQTNYNHLVDSLPVQAILEELVRTYVFFEGSDEYCRILAPAVAGDCAGSQELLSALSGKSANAFLYFIRAVEIVCPEVLRACQPPTDTQRYLLAVMNDEDRITLKLAFHWRDLLVQHGQCA